MFVFRPAIYENPKKIQKSLTFYKIKLSGLLLQLKRIKFGIIIGIFCFLI